MSKGRWPLELAKSGQVRTSQGQDGQVGQGHSPMLTCCVQGEGKREGEWGGKDRPWVLTSDLWDVMGTEYVLAEPPSVFQLLKLAMQNTNTLPETL